MTNIRKYKAKRKDNDEWIEGYYWASPKDEYGESFIIETYMKFPPSGHCNGKMGTRSIPIWLSTLTEINAPDLNSRSSDEDSLNNNYIQ